MLVRTCRARTMYEVVRFNALLPALCLVKLLASRFIKRGSNLIKLSGPRMAVCTLDPPTKGIKTREQGMRSCPAAATCQNQKAGKYL
jgi:hypothetical protein